MKTKADPQSDLIKRLKSFAKEAMLDNAAFSRLGQDDNSYDALALAKIARMLVSSLETGITPQPHAWPVYAGPSSDGMDELLEQPITADVAEAWLKMAEVALNNLI
jgi:hypothetical protein